MKNIKLTKEQVWDLLKDYALPTENGRYMVFGHNVKIVKDEAKSDIDFYNSIIKRRETKHENNTLDKLLWVIKSCLFWGFSMFFVSLLIKLLLLT